MAITLDAIQDVVFKGCGAVSTEHKCVSGNFQVPGAGPVYTQVLLRPGDPKAPDGVRVSCTAGKALDAVTDHVRQRLSLPPLPCAANDNASRLEFTATPYVWRATSDIPLRETLYGRHLIRGYIAADVAPGGLGKSTQIVTDALAMVTGRNLLGDEPAGRLRVWLWNGEDPKDEIERRIAAGCGFYNVSEAAIGGRLFVDSGRDKEIVIATEIGNGFKIAEPLVEGVNKAIRDNGIDVFSVDPFVTTHAVSENDNTRIAAVAKQWARIADETGCAVQIVHHVRKGEGKEFTADDARGAGALVNAARAVRVLNPMTVKEADKAGVPTADRFQYFRVANGKSNLTPRSDRSDWRRLVSQPMENGEGGLGRPQDHVCVVTRWDWPATACPVDDVPDGALDAIKARVRGGEFRKNEQAKDWVGNVVAEILDLDATDPAVKKRIQRMLAAWIAAGHFEIESRTDSKRREPKEFIVALPNLETGGAGKVEQ